jgi:hypothetical protein
MAEFPEEINRLEPGVVVAWGRTLDLIGQQRKSNLATHVTADLGYSESGDRVTDELAGLSEPQEVLYDWADSPDGHVDQFRRFAFFRTWNDGKFVGKREQAEKLVNPTNAVTMAMGAGKARNRDARIIDILHNSANEANEDGSVQSVSFPSGQIVAENENAFFKGKADGDSAPTAVTTLTPAKLRKAKVLLDASQIETMEFPKIAVEETDLQNMATSLEIVSRDFASFREDFVKANALAQGDTTHAFGFDFIKVAPGTLRRNAAGDQATCPIWLKENIIYRERQLVNSRIAERADKMFRWYAYHEWQTSGLRRQDKGVVHVLVSR